jgi:hypothetical protein
MADRVLRRLNRLLASGLARARDVARNDSGRKTTGAIDGMRPRVTVRLVVALFAWLVAHTAQAKCGFGQSIWPETGATIGPTDIVIIHAEHAILESWLASAVFRQEGGASIPAVLVERSTGGVHVGQAVLRAQTPLPPGRWTLSLMGLVARDTVYDVDTLQRAAPSWRSSPRTRATRYEEHGYEGPLSMLDVDVRIIGASWVRATLSPDVPSATGETFMLEIDEGKVHVGRTMCAGAFSMFPGARYRLRLEAVANDGVASSAKDMVVRGPAPKKRPKRTKTG